jgi:hypothetical protein
MSLFAVGNGVKLCPCVQTNFLKLLILINNYCKFHFENSSTPREPHYLSATFSNTQHSPEADSYLINIICKLIGGCCEKNN